MKTGTLIGWGVAVIAIAAGIATPEDPGRAIIVVIGLSIAMVAARVINRERDA